MSKNAIVTLSGGQDSTLALWYAKQTYDNVSAVAFNYGQLNKTELISAKKVADLAGVDLEVVNVQGALLAKDSMLLGGSGSSAFVPHRNAFFLLIAANRAYLKDASYVVTGICEEDNVHPDTSNAFRTKMQDLLAASIGGSLVVVDAPFVSTPKAKVLQQYFPNFECAYSLAYTTTSYTGEYPPTSTNVSSDLRAASFKQAGYADPLVLRAYYEGLMDLPSSENYSGLKNSAEVATFREYLEHYHNQVFSVSST